MRHFALLLLLGCPKEPPAAPAPDDPVAWVRAHVGHPVPLADVDLAFQALLSGLYVEGPGEEPTDTSEITALLGRVPRGCDEWWSLDQAAVAVQPPFDDDPPEQIAAAEAAIAGLLEGADVTLFCRGAPRACDEEEDPPCITPDQPIFAVNVHRTDAWRFRAWRDFTGPEGH